MAIDLSVEISAGDLLTPFHDGCKGAAVQLLGTESEKFGVQVANGAPVSYDGKKCGIVGFFEAIQAADARWEPVVEKPGGPIIAIERGTGPQKQQISLEPGAQLELSGAALATAHDVADELDGHLLEIAPTAAACGVRWLSVGYHPLATPAELPWVPKARYAIMREYFPTVGSRGLDMMRRTATIQVNVDYADEEDAMRKLVVGLKLGPIATAIFACSPFAAGRVNGLKSERAAVWLDTDNDRCGLIAALADATKPRFEHYVEWALDVPMYLIKRDGDVIANTGQTFRAFLADGFEGHRATMGDWVLHLNTVFPEARLQRTIELRSTDALPRRYAPAVPALWAGILYDDTALESAVSLVSTVKSAAIQAARPQIAKLGLGAMVGDQPVRDIALAMLEIASGGLSRRARLDAQGRDEQVHLEPIVALASAGRSPADVLLDGIEAEADLRAAILERTTI